ncbi:hypothetical protein KEM60_00299 [Austwickia sp. TVS 96-490-7B]|uniref:hypothetical protein n=1 Tax=Austwickia sp. TVS 96-490-7B TaxID=2830843 RepID=UPI001C55B312|nr:hypothetical protein [Austwickia sp. TVS 96-490-7B]MBW3084116.1 hypothetical protein [Austwickia sp. TVS 96-490-7B]
MAANFSTHTIPECDLFIFKPKPHPFSEDISLLIDRGWSSSLLDREKNLQSYDEFFGGFSRSSPLRPQLASALKRGIRGPEHVARFLSAEMILGVLLGMFPDSALTDVRLDYAKQGDSLESPAGRKDCFPGEPVVRTYSGEILASVIEGPSKASLVASSTDAFSYGFFKPANMSKQSAMEVLNILAI